MTMPLVYSRHNHGTSYGYGQLTGDRGETKKKKKRHPGRLPWRGQVGAGSGKGGNDWNGNGGRQWWGGASAWPEEVGDGEGAVVADEGGGGRRWMARAGGSRGLAKAVVDQLVVADGVASGQGATGDSGREHGWLGSHRAKGAAVAGADGGQ